MSDNVVGFKPKLAPTKAEPDPTIVALAEELLAGAKSGEVQGVVYGFMRADQIISTGWVGLACGANKYEVLGVIGSLEHHYRNAQNWGE